MRDGNAETARVGMAMNVVALAMRAMGACVPKWNI